MKLIITLLAVLFFHSFSGTTFAFQNIDECKLSKNSIVKTKVKLNLDEPFISTGDRFGFDYWFTDEDKFQITKVLPNIYEKLEKNGINPAELETAYPISINGIKVSNISKNDFKKYLDADKIEIGIEGIKKPITFEKKEYNLIKSDSVWVLFDKIDEINTKDESFFSKFRVISYWPDERLSKSFAEIVSKIAEADPAGFSKYGGSFSCSNLQKFISEENIHVSRIIPRRFTSSITKSKKTIGLEYRPPKMCSEKNPVTTCSPFEKKYGKVTYIVDEVFEGVLPVPLILNDFPFDNQYIPIELEAEVESSAQVSMTIGFGYDFQQENFIDRFYNSEWTMGQSNGIQNANIKDDWTGEYKQVILVWFEIIREGSYYIYKLILPITFLIILSWMVFFIKPKDLESRLTISIVVFLSLIAYNFVVSDDLPKIGYLTFMDSFILVSYIFAGIPTIQTVLVTYSEQNDGTFARGILDNIFRKYFMLMYVIAVFVVAIPLLSSKLT